MIALGIDPGERRIGIAVSDTRGVLARPLAVLPCQSLAADVARIKELAVSSRAGRVVVGLPLNLSGSAGPSARRARRFANALRRALDAEVVLWDERLTTVEAERARQAASERPARRRARPDARPRATRDSAAAAVMLQSYLDSQGTSGPEDRAPTAKGAQE